MKKVLSQFALVLFVMLAFAVPAFAQGAGGTSYTFAGAGIGAGLGAAFVMIGAGYGFGKIGAAALESMARQPETAAKVQVAMIIIAALLEGATFFALFICFSLANVNMVKF
jgi:F-type H+-transporting ATPase subunit c